MLVCVFSYAQGNCSCNLLVTRITLTSCRQSAAAAAANNAVSAECIMVHFVACVCDSGSSSSNNNIKSGKSKSFYLLSKVL